MCGIAGYVQKKDRFDSSHLKKMTDAIQHRGPDGEGAVFRDRGEWKVALGHRRLSIIDVAGGAQPMANEDKTLWLSYNGETYNFQELKKDLKESHRFQTRSDTEVLIHQFEERGVQAFRDWNGMFAFAFWDEKEGELILARDRSGIKPLYYTALDDGGFAFASELRALFQHLKVSRSIDTSALRSYFFVDYVHPDQSILNGVWKLPPGSFVVWRNGNLSQPVPFWDAKKELGQIEEPSSPHLERELQERLDSGVRRQLVSDVPVGVFLSGGIDSSLVAALAQKNKKEPIQTFSIGFEETDFDESPYSREVAQYLGTQHTEEIINEQKLLACLDEALSCIDEPLGDPSILPTYVLSGVASQKVKVVLGGDGGDEVWAGYPTYRAFGYGQIYRYLPGVLRRHLFPAAAAALPVQSTYQSFEWKAKRFTQRWDDHVYRRHLRWMSNTDVADLNQLFGPESEEPAVLTRFSNGYGSSFTDPLNSILALDYQTYLPGSVLTKVDRASMAHSLEVRPPLLDNDVLKWGFSLPSEWKLRDGQSKYLLKQVAARLLPERVVFRKKKGFAIPLARWLRGPLSSRLDRIFSESPVWELPHFSRETLQRWHQSHAALKEDRSRPLWNLIVLDHWMSHSL